MSWLLRHTHGVCEVLLGYETQKVVQIHSRGIGLIFRLIQLGIIVYVIGWVMIRDRGYQRHDSAVSGVTAKLKGIAYVHNDLIGRRVFDAADYVIPPQQKSAFFIMTNMVSTDGQRLGQCEEAHDVKGNDCKNNTDCIAGELINLGSGMKTGNCVPSTRSTNKNVCEIYGWCPTEFDVQPRPALLNSAENFTVLLKNSIEFPYYKVKRRNILSWMDRTFLKECRYDPNNEKNKYCPIFRIGDILKYTGANNSDIYLFGGMVSINIEWSCNLDYDVDQCVPKYDVRRLDDYVSPVGKGWNFRFGQHYRSNNVSYRNLIKAYGIQFFITVYGRGGKFDILTFSMNLGSGLALLGIATVLCDMIVLNITRNRSLYRSAKVDMLPSKRGADKGEDTEPSLNRPESTPSLDRLSNRAEGLGTRQKSLGSIYRMKESRSMQLPSSVPGKRRLRHLKNGRSRFGRPKADGALDEAEQGLKRFNSQPLPTFYACVPQTIVDALTPVSSPQDPGTPCMNERFC